MAKKQKKKLYVICFGRRKGIVDDWKACRRLIYKYGGAKYKSFDNFEEMDSYIYLEMPRGKRHYIIEVGDMELGFDDYESFYNAMESLNLL